MLQTLRIKNLALVNEVTIDFAPGFNVITGETGAGKSMLLGALKLVLGERADKSLIRSGAPHCAVEATFQLSPSLLLDPWLEAHGLEPCEGGQLTVKRHFTEAGANRQFINGSLTTLNVLNDLGDKLVDLHGPHDHQSLLHHEYQLAMLDAYGGLSHLVEQYQAARNRWQAAEHKIAALVVDEREYNQKIDLFRHQIREIELARLQPGEDREISEKYQRAQNGRRLLELSQGALELAASGENSLQQQCQALSRLLQELHRLDPSTGFPETLTELRTHLDDLSRALERYSENLETDPCQLQELEDRLNAIQLLKKKYGPSLEEVVAFGRDTAKKLQDLESRDQQLEVLRAEKAEAQEAINRSAAQLTAERRKVIPQLTKAISEELAGLGFVKAAFHLDLSSSKVVLPENKQGRDEIEFQFSPNIGEPLRPLRLIASSGELARVMLALKCCLARVDRIPILVFDEADANVAGETARKLGEKLKETAAHHQVLCITHLAPVAAFAGHHFAVRKEESGGRTTTVIEVMDGSARINELARMLGGPSQTAKQHARELLAESAQ